MMQKIKIINQKYIYQSRYFSVIEKTSQKEKQTFTKEFISRNPVVLILAITPENEIYLARQYREALEKVSLELIAGNIDTGEDALTAAKRELSEEAGITAKNWKRLATMHLSANMIATMDIFLATGLQEGEAHPDDDESIEIIKIPFAQAVQKVITGEINTSLHASAILLLDNLQKQGKI
jgi:ADP-ribose pyrophosphatase